MRFSGRVEVNEAKEGEGEAEDIALGEWQLLRRDFIEMQDPLQEMHQAGTTARSKGK